MPILVSTWADGVFALTGDVRIHELPGRAIGALAVERVSSRARGRALTLLVGAFNGGTAVASNVLGPIAKHFGFEAAFVVGAVVAGLGVVTLGGAVPVRESRVA